MEGLKMTPDAIFRALLSERCTQMLTQDTGLCFGGESGEQLSLFGSSSELLSESAHAVLRGELLPIARRLTAGEFVGADEKYECAVGQF